MIQTYKKPIQATTKVFTQPSVRSDLDWTPSRLKSAMIMADSGHMRMLADLCEVIMADDRAGADLLKRVRSISGTMPVFQSSGDGRKGGTVVKALGSLRDGGGGDWWEMLPEAEYGLVKAWGIVSGIGVGQLVWKKHRGRDIPCIEPWHTRHLQFDKDAGKWMTLVKRGSGTAVVPIDEGTGRWFVYTPYGRIRPWARGLCRGLSHWWLLKYYAIHDWGRHSENASTLVGLSPKGATKEHRKELAANLYSMAKNAVVVLPPDFDLKIVEATANTRDIYDAQIQAANLAMTIAITGVNLPTHATGGSYAAMTEQSSVATSVRQADAEIDSTQTRAQVLKPWAEKNYGSTELAPWPHWDVRRPEEKLSLAEAQGKLGESIEKLKKASPKVDAETILEDAGIPLMSEAELEAKDEKDMERRKKMGLVPDQNQPQAQQGPQQGPPKPDDAKPPAAPSKPEQTTWELPNGTKLVGFTESGERVIGMARSSEFEKLNQDQFMTELEDEAITHLVADLRPFVDDILERIESAETIEDMKKVVLEAFADDESPEAVETLERAMLLAHLAGVAAALEGD